MKKVFFLLAVCMLVALGSCNDNSPKGRVNKLKDMVDDMVELSEKKGPASDAVTEKYNEIDEYGLELMEESKDWDQKDAEYLKDYIKEIKKDPKVKKIITLQNLKKKYDVKTDYDMDDAMDAFDASVKAQKELEKAAKELSY